MLIGVISGAYSSIFVAAPILSVLKEREPKYTQLRVRATSRGAARQLRAVPGGKALASGGDGRAEEGAAVAAAPAVSGTRPGARGQARAAQASRGRPRPKKKRRRR
jgi:preprotein translocase subunit SecF